MTKEKRPTLHLPKKKPELAFGLHGAWRVGRTRLTKAEVAAVITNHQYILLGKEDGTEKAHKLFFDRSSNLYFVAVHDEKDNEIVTILPRDYHRWVVSSDALEQARELIMGPRPKPVAHKVPMDFIQPPEGTFANFRAKVEYTSGKGNKRHGWKSLGLVPIEGLGNTLDEVAKNPDTLSFFLRIFHERMTSRYRCITIVLEMRGAEYRIENITPAQ